MRFTPLLCAVLLARFAAGQAASSARRPGTTISGVVHDSIAHVALAGAMVQLVAADTQTRFGGSTISDSLGRFSIADVPRGRYTIGFLHPMLDSLGLEPTLREVTVADRDSVRANLAIPSPARLRVAICGQRTARDSGAVVVGVVRDARDRVPAAGVAVTGQWLEMALARGSVAGHMARLVATTKQSGWFALCDVPSPGTMTLVASRGADSTDVVELHVTEDGFLRRELYIGAARTDTVPRTDSVAAPRRMHVGDGRLSGTVLTKVGKQPIVGAQVSIVNGPQTRTNALGEWTLANAPAGTRMLEVRAVSFYPERRPVDILTDAAPVHVTLSTLKAVLDTVKVVARRGLLEEVRGFEQRRRMGTGHYITREQIARREPLLISDMLRLVPGVRIDRTQTDSTSLLIRAAVDARLMNSIVVDTIGTFAGRSLQSTVDWCSPAIFMDNWLLRGLSVQDLDEWVHPEDVTGIEVYTGISAPAQFQASLHGCGSIVIWTR